MKHGILKTVAFFILIAAATMWTQTASTAQSAKGAEGEAGAELPREIQDNMVLFDDDEVLSPTRFPEPINRTSMDVTIFTAYDIEDMQAHNLAEVLERAHGLFINPLGRDVGSPSLIYNEASEDRQTLVLVDGKPWNYLSGGNAEVNSIPVQIIEKIEIIHGAASTTWGSALGGVISIYTKNSLQSGDGTNGKISASYGKSKSQHYKAEISGGELFEYFLSAGHQYSEGLVESRGFNAYNLFSKFILHPTNFTDITFSAGFSRPKSSISYQPFEDLRQDSREHVFWASASVDTYIKSDLKLHLDVRYLKRKLESDVETVGLYGPGGEVYSIEAYDEESINVSGQISWQTTSHTLVIGSDFDHEKLDQSIENGLLFQSVGAQQTIKTNPNVNKWAAYVNDTIVLGSGKWSIIPGLRYDWDSKIGSFISPSIGFAYQLKKTTILRASAGRGFSAPPLSWTSGGGRLLDPNPDIDPEEVWSFQVGVESKALDHIRIKSNIFYHETTNSFVKELYAGGPPKYNDIWENNGAIKRKGIKFSLETSPIWECLTFWTGLAYTDLDPASVYGISHIYSCDVALKFNDNNSFKAELYGHYIYWGVDKIWNADYDMIFDLNVAKEIWKEKTGNTSMELFIKIHNLAQGSQRIYEVFDNPKRWGECGIRLKF